MKDYFVLTYSKDCDVNLASNAVTSLSNIFPDKAIIGLPEMIDLKMYSKEELINLLEFYTDYIKGLIND